MCTADACLRCQAENRQEECVGMYHCCDINIFALNFKMKEMLNFGCIVNLPCVLHFTFDLCISDSAMMMQCLLFSNKCDDTHTVTRTQKLLGLLLLSSLLLEYSGITILCSKYVNSTY